MDRQTVGWEVINQGGDGRFVVLVVDAAKKKKYINKFERSLPIYYMGSRIDSGGNLLNIDYCTNFFLCCFPTKNSNPEIECNYRILNPKGSQMRFQKLNSENKIQFAIFALSLSDCLLFF